MQGQKYFVHIVILLQADSIIDATTQANDIVKFQHVNQGGMKNAYVMQVDVQPENKQVKQA